MTDTYIWQKVRNRFYSMKRTVLNKETGEKETEWFPYFRKLVIDDEGNVDEVNEITYEDFKDEESVRLNVIEPNKTMISLSDDIWFEIFPLHSQPFQKEWGRSGRGRWIFGVQVNINCPKDLGTYDLDEVYDFIADNFRSGDIFDGVRVTETAYRSSARIVDDTFYSMPVTIMFRADLAK